MNETNLTCCCCGAELTPENSYQFDNNTYCANCFHDLTVECEDCGRRIYRDDAITTTSSYVICQHCYDRNYLTCERCGNAVYLDDAYYMDDDEDDDVAVSLSDEEMTQLSWTDFLNGIDREKNTELFTYLEERNLLTEKEGIA